MTKMIQIRNVPDELHRKLKVRAAREGMTLSDYLLSEVEQVAEKPPLRELMGRLRERGRGGGAAAGGGTPRSDCLLSGVDQVAEKPTLRELMERLRQREPVDLDEPPEAIIRRMRDADDPRDLGSRFLLVLDAPAPL